MARVRDLWHQARPAENAPECGQHTSRTKRMVATSRHGVGLRWQAEWTAPDRTTATKGFERKPDAEAHLASMQTDVQRGEYIDPRAGQIKIAKLADEWAAGQAVGGTSQDKYKYKVAGIKRAFKGVDVADLRTSAVRKWRDTRSKAVAARTVNEELGILSAICQDAVDDDRIRKNPCAKVKRLKVPRRGREPFTLDTIRGLIEAHPKKRRPIPALAFGAGLRQGEATAVAVDDIDWLRRRLDVRRQIVEARGKLWFKAPKYDGTGTVPLLPELVELLSAHVAAHPPVEVTLPWLDEAVARGRREPKMVTAKLLVAGDGGLALHPRAVTRMWTSALKKVGITPAGKETGIHLMRHAYASYSLHEGKPPIKVQGALRHKKLNELTDVYAHVLAAVDAEGPTPDLIASVFRSRSVSVPERAQL